MGDLSREKAYRLAERVASISPSACRVNIFQAEDGKDYAATVTIELGETGSFAISEFLAQVEALRGIAEEEGVRLGISHTPLFLFDSPD